jgi:transcription elongation GreA/GreB family factor
MSIADRRTSTAAKRPDPFGLRCATCELRITSHPEWHDGQAFCCAGCLAGGPCNCVADAGEALTQAADGTRRIAAGWPIDGRVMLDLLARIDRLARDARTGADADHDQRLDVLRRHARAVLVTFEPDVAAVGRRVTIQGEDQRTESFWLALPGEEHATADTLSIATGLGRALAGARVGDVVYVDTDGRRHWAVVLYVA